MSAPASGSLVVIEAVQPKSVCCPHALLACALLSVGVPEHPQFPFSITHEEVEGQAQIVWRWAFTGESSDGLYQTAQLIAWWHDETWLAAHPRHEWAILKRSLENMGEVASRIRATVSRVVVRRGDLAAHIPATATPARRQWLLDQLEGRIPVGTKFTEPAAA